MAGVFGRTDDRLGSHHVDIALWGIGRDRSGPSEISGTARYPNIRDGYNVPIDFEARFAFDDGLVVKVSDHGRNGVMFEGEEGRIFVNRENLAGKPVDQLQSDPLPRKTTGSTATIICSAPRGRASWMRSSTTWAIFTIAC